MTRIKFFESGGVITGFELEGHAGAGLYGNDIVCAALSSAVLMAANTITEIIGAKAEIKEREGFLSVRLSDKNPQACNQVLRGLKLHLTELERQYADNIKITTEV